MVKVSGKGYKTVPILFTPDMEVAMSTLVKTRTSAGVNSSNVYFFAVPNTKNSFIRFYHTMKNCSKAANISQPELITSTRLRKYAATVFQVLL
jgi:hypothetical protein